MLLLRALPFGDRRTALNRNTTIVVSVLTILLMFGNAWQAWTIQDLRADLEVAEGQVNAVKMRVAAAMGPSAIEQGKRQQKGTPKTSGDEQPEPNDRRPSRDQAVKVGGVPTAAGSAVSAEAQVERRGHLRDAVLNKMLDRVAQIAQERGWDEGVAADAMDILEDSVAATAEVRVAMDAGHYTVTEAKDEVLRIKDDAAFALEDALGPEEHQFLQEALWAKSGR
ncbi:MAG: hypothetical protein GWP91_12370 [Rhodobacterales bacterium]|nr:hypothetical protein [Rhodobacterales bacterium]